MDPLAEQSDTYTVHCGWPATSYLVQTETRPLAGYQSAPLARNANAPLPHWLRAWWEQRATDALWLAVLALLNAAVFGWRFACFPRDAAADYWPAIAKGSAELVLLDTAVAIVAVCYRAVGRFNVTLRRHASGASYSYLPPLDKPLALHKVMGVVVVAASALHSLAWVVIITRLRQCSLEEWRASGFHDRLGFLRDAPSMLRLCRELPVWTGAAMLLCLAVAAPFCIPRVRERSFKYFALAHGALAPFVLLLLFHGVERWTGAIQTPFWLAPALLVYGVERMRRLPLLLPSAWPMLQRRTQATIEIAKRHKDTLVLELSECSALGRRLEPGMYVFVAVPALSRWEWHPFSVASAPEDERMHLHIRVVGDWTEALSRALLGANDAEAEGNYHAQPSHELLVHLDGPVASPTVLFREYSRLALISTGVGVTPHLSVLRHLLHSRRLLLQRAHAPSCRATLRMIWSTRHIEHTQWVLDTLDEFSAELEAFPRAFVIALHVTEVPSPQALETCDPRRRLLDRLALAVRRFPVLHVEFARVSWPTTIDRLVKSTDAPAEDTGEHGADATPPPLGVFVCSRAKLAKQLKRTVTAAAVAHRLASGRKRRVDVFAEGF